MSMKAKNPISLREHLQTWPLEIDSASEESEEETPTPPCERCKGLGVLKEVLEAGELGVKAERSRIISCLYCQKGHLREREIQDRRLSRTELPSKYAAADLNRWGDPQHESRKGKVKAYLACRAMLEDPKHLVSSQRVAKYHLRLFGKNSPSWVHQDLAAADQSRCGIVLWGDYGVGKTWLAAATMNALAQLNSYVLYMRMTDLLQSLRDSWRGDEKTGELLQKYAMAQVLFIDDMSDSSQDSHPLPAYQQDYAAAIMRERMGNMRPTIVTTNWNWETFSTKWGRVCAEVMREDLNWIEMTGRMRDLSDTLGE
jgi:hypothetical protein